MKKALVMFTLGGILLMGAVADAAVPIDQAVQPPAQAGQTQPSNQGAVQQPNPANSGSKLFDIKMPPRELYTPKMEDVTGNPAIKLFLAIGTLVLGAFSVVFVLLGFGVIAFTSKDVITGKEKGQSLLVKALSIAGGLVGLVFTINGLWYDFLALIVKAVARAFGHSIDL